ncbi:spermidine synthase [Vallicoccus soli]|uniref:Spermine synthase n=1 Tax=Vallicoccus soli TaxID=2339232 RepID=A0A3A3Z2X8_9ACTN|nr:fused MFS/spermidine synthase [Vallicoccus soli]RJK94811.1 spermine synthase [Vallicoccus soli]
MGRRGPERDDPSGAHPVDGGTARLEEDVPGAWTLLVDGTPQSHVDLRDPTNLSYEYVRRIGHAVDLLRPPGEAVRAVHLGGGGLTLPRYVAATRPGSRQQVVEVDAALVQLVRRALPWPRDWRIKVRVGDARDALARLDPGLADLVVSDVFAGARTPARLTSVEAVRTAARALADDGVLAVNVGDGPPLRFARAQVATVAAVLPRVCLVAEPAVLRGRRFGNLVLLASRRPLPVAELTRRCASDPVAARVVDGPDLEAFAAGALPVTDAEAEDSPEPPSPW